MCACCPYIASTLAVLSGGFQWGFMLKQPCNTYIYEDAEVDAEQCVTARVLSDESLCVHTALFLRHASQTMP